VEDFYSRFAPHQAVPGLPEVQSGPAFDVMVAWPIVLIMVPAHLNACLSIEINLFFVPVY